MNTKPPIRPERIRNIHNRSFAYIPHRFLQDGFFASLSNMERALYLFLILASDRYGLSFYRYDRICSILEITIDDYIHARNALIQKDLIAYDGTRLQVLSLPESPRLLPTRELQFQNGMHDKNSDPAQIHNTLLHALRAEINPPTSED